ncbi:TPA: helix-turn-helix transcriptional regulator [Staphylococcus aureus]|nr:helix-turn-helix domain-containing protein [Staphylococcus aureus]WRN84548.1 helix-turn-helix domain-containing protein [Staphylococcus aureus]
MKEKFNISQTELSKKTNICRQTINTLENGSYLPSLKTLKKYHYSLILV